MIDERLKKRFAEIERIGLAMGLNPYDIHYFEVPSPVIWQTASYGLPTRYSHWSFGRYFEFQKMQGTMGFSKIYELILNSNPSIAYLDKNNTHTSNLLIAAHCSAHSHVFKNNILFKQSGETDMVNVAASHAKIIDQFRNEYGDDEVDEWLDAALALEHHIDVYKGIKRSKYPERHVVYEEQEKRTEWNDIVNLVGEQKPIVKRVMKNIHIPPVPEKDLLWFFIEYANLESWQRKIFDIVRRESYYFWPQYNTKIVHEGAASFFHAEIMMQYALGNKNDYGVTDIEYPLTDEEHLDFVTSHSSVVQPGLKLNLKVQFPDGSEGWNPVFRNNPRLFNYAIKLNPYYVGFTILRDIRKRWDQYKEQGYRENEWGEKIPVTINGLQKVLEVIDEEDDTSLMRNYLTEELCDELHLFTYGNSEEYDDEYNVQEDIQNRVKRNKDVSLGKMSVDDQIIKNRTVQVNSKKLNDVINAFARDHSNYGVPNIVIRRIDESGLLRLEHIPSNKPNLDLNYTENVLKYIYRIWRRPVELIRKSKKSSKTYVLSYNGLDFESNYQTLEYPEIVEKEEAPSAW